MEILENLSISTESSIRQCFLRRKRQGVLSVLRERQGVLSVLSTTTALGPRSVSGTKERDL